MINILKQALGSITGGTVLDVGTGKGDFIKTLRGNLKSHREIIGVDTKVYTRVIGSVFDVENVRFIQMDAQQLGFCDESFDTLSISSALHHLENVPKCLGETKRVLKPGGHIIIREAHRDIQAEPQRTDMYIHHWVAEVDSARGFTHNKTFARQELIDLVEGLGLWTVDVYDISNTDSDPMNETAIRESEDVIERCMGYTQGLSGHESLRRRGEELQERLRRVGVQWEPELIFVGVKQ